MDAVCLGIVVVMYVLTIGLTRVLEGLGKRS